MSYRFDPAAKAELADTVAYYASHASPKIAQAFLDEFERIIALLIKTPKIGTLGVAGLRIHPLHRFPYSVVYRDTKDQLIVYAVANQRRRPNYWVTRIQKS